MWLFAVEIWLLEFVSKCGNQGPVLRALLRYVPLHTEKTDGALENASAASYIAINLKVPVKFQKAGTDFTIRPHLDLPWEWGGGDMKRH